MKGFFLGLFLTTGLLTACSDTRKIRDTTKTGLVEQQPVSGQSGSQVKATSDLEREARLAEQIIDTIFDGEPVWLEAEGHKFLGIYMASQTGASGKAALILHGRGYHPDWEQVVRPLRTGLTRFGWNTLSLQMPVLEKTAKFYDYVPVFHQAFPRIEAGIRYLKAQGNKTIVLISHSCGVHMAMAWIRNRDSSEMDGFVGIGMGATDYKQPMKEPFPFEKISVPILDIYGAMDYPAVQDGAPDRLAAIQASGNPQSRQIILDEADHYMHEQDVVLIETVSGWLNEVFE